MDSYEFHVDSGTLALDINQPIDCLHHIKGEGRTALDWLQKNTDSIIKAIGLHKLMFIKSEVAYELNMLESTGHTPTHADVYITLAFFD